VKTQICKTCGLEKLLIKFGINNPGTTRESMRQSCHTCVNEKKHNTSLGHIRRLCCQYGMTDQHYMQMEFDQKGKCAICKQKKSLDIDHNHITHRVRGLLCQNCNVGLGQFMDDPEVLKEAIIYLEKNE